MWKYVAEIFHWRWPSIKAACHFMKLWTNVDKLTYSVMRHKTTSLLHMASQILFNSGSGYGLVPDSTTPLAEPKCWFVITMSTWIHIISFPMSSGKYSRFPLQHGQFSPKHNTPNSLAHTPGRYMVGCIHEFKINSVFSMLAIDTLHVIPCSIWSCYDDPNYQIIFDYNIW